MPKSPPPRNLGQNKPTSPAVVPFCFSSVLEINRKTSPTRVYTSLVPVTLLRMLELPNILHKSFLVDQAGISAVSQDTNISEAELRKTFIY